MSLLMEQCPFFKRMSLPFICLRGALLKGGGRNKERERERESFLAPFVGVVSSVSWDR
jgi:hypothetical protein